MPNGRRVFVEPILKGKRFADSSLPYELLPDLECYLKIISAVAKELYRKEHPGKTRLPRGFDERFKVRLTSLQAGSAVAVFSREYDEAGWENDEFDRARDQVNQQLISLEEKQQSLGFSEKILPLFKSFGENLKPDETIELRIPGRQRAAVYSRKVRSGVLAINQQPYQDVCYLTGSISGFDAEKRKLFIVLEDGQPIEGPLAASFDTLLRDIAPKYKKQDIAVTLIGIAKYQPDGSVAEIKQLQHLIVYQDGTPEFFPNPESQLTTLSDLPDINTVRDWLTNLLKAGDIPAPFIYPADHGIECEWSFGYWEISFSFLITTKIVVLHAAHINSEAVQENRLPLQDPESIEKAKQFLKTLLRKTQDQ